MELNGGSGTGHLEQPSSLCVLRGTLSPGLPQQGVSVGERLQSLKEPVPAADAKARLKASWLQAGSIKA